MTSRKVKAVIGKIRRGVIGGKEDILYGVYWSRDTSIPPSNPYEKSGVGFTYVWAKNTVQAIRRARRVLGQAKIVKTKAKSFHAKPFSAIVRKRCS